MTEAQFKRRFRYWWEHPAMRFLGVSHYEYTVEFFPDVGADEERWASVGTNPLYDTTSFSFNEAILDTNDLFVDRTIVHEILHVGERDLQAALRDVSDKLAPDLAEAYESRIKAARESFIDRLARLIVSAAG